MEDQKKQEKELPKAQQPLPKPEERTKSAIEAAKALADRIDAGNAKAEELLRRQEALHAEQMLSGRADAGQQPEQPKKETDKEYAQRIARGDLKDDEGRYD